MLAIDDLRNFFGEQYRKGNIEKQLGVFIDFSRFTKDLNTLIQERSVMGDKNETIGA